MQTFSYRTSNDIAVTIRRPDSQASVPVIVLCHGFCGTQEMLLPSFAVAFALAGYAAVTFDYRGFGLSGGEKGRLIPSMQIEDIATVVTFVKELPGIDAQRVGLWGTSLGGGHVLATAASDRSIKAAVSQLGFADGEQVVTRHMTEPGKLAFVATIERMYEKRKAPERRCLSRLRKY
ncbi:alpha/beta hydrolase [Paraburkholderia hospita]|nr:alpha/beta fold hydrolase [Paraburkholderia hospita]OUL85451.1 alpha/beta hydrolase [Paraburkholderia hospita]OUL92112.1 alpha/beta hydrolase [Paraburkholderia hospita]